MDTSVWMQFLVNGLVLGSVYCLLAVGLSMIFGVLEVVNFAHGELYMLGAFVGFATFPILGYVGGLAVSFLVMGLLGAALYQGLLTRIEGKHHLELSILLTIGLAMILQNAAMNVLGSAPRTTPTDFLAGSITLLGATLSHSRMLVVIVTVVSMGGIALLLNRTSFGRAMRAVPQNREAALMVGIAPRQIGIITMSLGAALAGVAGASLAPVYALSPVMGTAVVFKAFAIIIIGGMGSIRGAALTAIGVGLVESLAGGLGSPVLQDSVVFILMILVLFLKPEGLFGDTVRI